MHETLTKCYTLPLIDRTCESIKKTRNWRNSIHWRSDGMHVKWATCFQAHIPCWQKVRGFS